jgi:glycosyltransferase involved in cell wall biosynthesis
MYQGYKLAVVVPAYNEETLIAETLNNMPAEADRIYVVDDASTDATRLIVQRFVNGKIRLLGNGHNQGVGAAIASGYKKALEEDMDVIVVMAGDNQMDKKHLPSLLAPILEGKADYTKGNRLSRLEHKKGMSSWRFFGNCLLTMITKIASGYRGIRDPQNGYTAITKGTLKKISLDDIYPRYGYCNDLLIKLKAARCRVVDVAMPARYGNEKSKIGYSKYIIHVSSLLLRGLLWRLKVKFLKCDTCTPRKESSRILSRSEG